MNLKFKILFCSFSIGSVTSTDAGMRMAGVNATNGVKIWFRLMTMRDTPAVASRDEISSLSIVIKIRRQIFAQFLHLIGK